MFWICYEKCFSYCWSGLTQHQGLFCSSSRPPVRRLGVHKKLGGDIWRGRWPQLTTEVSHSHSKEGGRGDLWSDGIFVPKSLLHVIDLCFTGGDWKPTCPWEVVNQFLVLFCFALLACTSLFSLSNCLYLNAWVFSLLFFICSSCHQAFFGRGKAVVKRVAGNSNKWKWSCRWSPPPD